MGIPRTALSGHPLRGLDLSNLFLRKVGTTNTGVSHSVAVNRTLSSVTPYPQVRFPQHLSEIPLEEMPILTTVDSSHVLIPAHRGCR